MDGEENKSLVQKFCLNDCETLTKRNVQGNGPLFHWTGSLKYTNPAIYRDRHQTPALCKAAGIKHFTTSDPTKSDPSLPYGTKSDPTGLVGCKSHQIRRFQVYFFYLFGRLQNPPN